MQSGSVYETHSRAHFCISITEFRNTMHILHLSLKALNECVYLVFMFSKSKLYLHFDIYFRFTYILYKVPINSIMQHYKFPSISQRNYCILAALIDLLTLLIEILREKERNYFFLYKALVSQILVCRAKDVKFPAW